MKYNTFRQKLKIPIFTPQNLRNLGLDLYPNELTRWIKQDYLTKLRGGLYALTDTLPTLTPAMIAPYLVSPSYISLSTALSHHGIIPEAVFSTTSVTSKGTRSYHLPQGNFTYQHLPPRLFFGYTQIPSSPLPYLLAEPEKALLDFFYLTPSIKNTKDLFELRLNLNSLDWVKLKTYASFFKHKRLNYLFKLLETSHAHA